MDNSTILLFGASGHGKVIADILECMGMEHITFWDDHERPHFPYPVTYPNLLENIANCIISIGDNRIRKTIANRLSVNFIQAIHPASHISPHVLIEDGTVIMAGVVINPGVRIGTHCIINTVASIDHDCTLENFVHISPGAHLAGGVKVGEGTLIGMGSNIIQGITIGKWVTVGAGSVILYDIPDYAVVIGVPGTIIKYNSVMPAYD